MEGMFSHIKLFYKDYMHFASRSRIMLEMVIVDAAILAFIAYKISQIDNVRTLWTGGMAFSATLAGFSYFLICWTVTFMGPILSPPIILTISEVASLAITLPLLMRIILSQVSATSYMRWELITMSFVFLRSLSTFLKIFDS